MMHAIVTVLGLTLVAAQPPGAQPPATQPPASPLSRIPPPGRGVEPDPAIMNMSDGIWTILCLEREGKPVPDAKGVSAEAKDNVVTFTTVGRAGPGRAEGKALRPMRLTFGPGNAVQVLEANSDGRFGEAGPITPTKLNGNPNQPADNKFSTAPSPGTLQPGVYALTQDYLVVSVPRIVERSSGVAANPGGTPPTGSGPDSETSFTLILKRTGPSPAVGAPAKR